MVAPKGNQFWKARSSHGRKPIFDSEKKLLEACEEYFQWVEDNPLYEQKAFSYQGEVIKTDIYKMRAMTLQGLTLFLDISMDTWCNYRKKEDFLEVTSQIEKAIYQQKFTGASADLINANNIARDLGLKDKTEQSGLIGHIDLTNKTDQELKDIVSGKETA